MTEEIKTKRRRYSLVLSDYTFEEISKLAKELDTSVVEVIKKFLRLGLLMYKYQEDPDVSVQIVEKDKTPIEFKII